jgi:hypothetical protein
MTPPEEKLNQLTLSTMSRQPETTLTEAAAKNLSTAATLKWLTDMEAEARKPNTIGVFLEQFRARLAKFGLEL